MTGSPHRLRLFIAAGIPQDVLTDLNSAASPFRDAINGARWTEPEAQHVTLKFLGSLHPSLQEGVAAACEAVAEGLPAAPIVVSGFGAFPSARRARVLWAGIQDEQNLLARLTGRLDEELQTLGMSPESREFTPHLTLARLKVPSDVRTALAAVGFTSAPVLLSTFHLFRSHLSPKGARYEVLQSFVLRDDARPKARRGDILESMEGPE